MSLDPEFRRVTQHNIEVLIELAGKSSEDQSYLKRVWKFEHQYDFMYGSIVGFLEGTSIMILKMTFGRAATQDERAEIKEIIESYAPKIREKLAKLKGQS